MPSFLFPRTVDIRRSNTVAGSTDAVGDVGYSGEVGNLQPASNPQGETLRFSKVPCSIQPDSPGRPSGNSLPQDATNHPRWLILIPNGIVPKGQVRDRDIFIDDEQYRYEVISASWTPLGWGFHCLRLEA